MESTLSKKINNFRVSIRKQQIEAYKKSKRREFSQEHQTDLIQTENTNSQTVEMYSSILEATTFQNLLSMDQETLGNNIQMLIEIVGGKSSHLFVNRLQNLICTLVDFFQYNYNLYHCQTAEELNKNYMTQSQMRQRQRIINAIAFDRLHDLIKLNNFLKLIALIYYEISPKNLTYISKTVVIVRQILSYVTIDRSVMSDYRSHFGINKSQQNNQSINKSTALLILLNITHAQEYQVLEIVYSENILYCIAGWIEQLGCFQMYEKQIVAGIYANCIEYLCQRAICQKSKCQRTRQETFSQQSTQMEDVNQKENFLFLNLFQCLLCTENTHIFDKLVFIAVNLLKTSKTQTLACLGYLIQLSNNFVLNIVTSKEYYQQSQDLFIILSELYDSNSSFNVLLQFLEIILTKHTVVYYQDRNMEKNRDNGEHHSNSKLKGLQNISKLLQSCENLLTNPNITVEGQQAFFRYIVEFWCTEELYGIRLEMINFVTTALLVSVDLSDIILDQFSDITTHLMNQSCERADQIEAQLKLFEVFLDRSQNKGIQYQQQFIQLNSHVFEEIIVRLQDYLMRFRFSNSDPTKYKLTEICLHRIEMIFKNSGAL